MSLPSKDKRDCRVCYKRKPASAFTLLRACCDECVASGRTYKRQPDYYGVIVKGVVPNVAQKDPWEPKRVFHPCTVCYGLPHRVEGERCRKCGLVRKEDAA